MINDTFTMIMMSLPVNSFLKAILHIIYAVFQIAVTGQDKNLDSYKILFVVKNDAYFYVFHVLI